MLQCGKLKANKKANSETISREEPKGMRYMEENNKQPGLDPEAKTEKLEATPADKGQAGATEKPGNGDPRRQAQGREDGDRRAPYREVPVEAGR